MIQARRIIGILAIVAFVGGVLFIALKTENPTDTNQNSIVDNTSGSNLVDNTNTNSSSNTSISTNSSNSSTTVKSYTLSDIAKHASASSCFTTVNNNVYDVTNWVNKHPGGEETILLMCGKDSSSYFNQQHKGERKPENILASFKIGILKK